MGVICGGILMGIGDCSVVDGAVVVVQSGFIGGGEGEVVTGVILG